MSKLCKYCGAEMDDEAFECPECLHKYPGAELKAKQKAIEKKNKMKKRLTVGGLCTGAVALIVILSVVLSSVFQKPYTKPIDSYIKGCTLNSYEKYMDAFTPFYGRYLSEYYSYIMLGEVPEDDQKVYTAAILYLDNYYQELMKEFGNDLSVTYKVYNEKQYTPEELEEYRQEYISVVPDDLKDTSFDDGYELYVIFRVKGNLGVNSIKQEKFQVFKIDGKWRMMTYLDFLAKEDETKDVETYR